MSTISATEEPTKMDEEQPKALTDATSDASATKTEQDEANMTAEERALASRRAYNRMNAARARKRTKDQINTLRLQVQSHADSNARLQKSNKELSDRLAMLEAENQLLRNKVFGQQLDDNGLGARTSSMMGGVGAGTGGIPDHHGPSGNLKHMMNSMHPESSPGFNNNSYVSQMSIQQRMALLHPNIQQQLFAAGNGNMSDPAEAEKKQALLRYILTGNQG